MKASYLADQFAAGFPYDRYVASGDPEQQRRWQQVYEAAGLSESQQKLAGAFSRDMKILVISGIWCGDCVQQVPLLQRIVEANHARLAMRIVDRDVHRHLVDELYINGGSRVPVVLFLAEDFELCSICGDRTLRRYRAMATRQLGAACPVAITPPDPDELAATLQDWLDEFERIQLMLRLSTRLRQKHGD